MNQTILENNEITVLIVLYKETFDLMLQYLELHLPNVNVNKTRKIIHEIFH